MNDPTRIDGVLESLRAAWEGQPDLSLPTLLAMLGNEGIGWGSSDEEARRVLDGWAWVNPPLITPDAVGASARWLVECEGPAARVTLQAGAVVVRGIGADGRSRQPVVWQWDSFRPAGPGRPLVVRDSEGIEHRLGLVRRITRLEDAPAHPRDGLRRKDLGERVYVARTEEGVVLIDHGLHVWTLGRRTLERADFGWERIEQCRPGADLEVALRGGVMRGFGRVESVWLAEAAAADPLDATR